MELGANKDFISFSRVGSKVVKFNEKRWGKKGRAKKENILQILKRLKKLMQKK